MFPAQDRHALSQFFEFIYEKLATFETTSGDSLAVLDDIMASLLLIIGKLDAVLDEDQTTQETVHFNGTVGVAAVSVPAVAGGSITSLILENVNENVGQELYISFDGGTTFKTVKPSYVFTADPRGDITQIQLKGGSAGCLYEFVMNREV